MKIALVEGRRREAEPGLSGKCPGCDAILIARCGERRVWHWAHHGDRHCDHWWERETEWHRAWKSKFPFEWQEAVHHAQSGEKHIADVKTEHGRVIEFQHSYLEPEERRCRETFYVSMVWVVDGLRRIRDKPRFFEALHKRQLVGLKPLTYLVSSDRCALLRDWVGSRVGVFFDFGTAPEVHLYGVPVLWHLSPKSVNGWALLTPVPVVNFLEAHLRGVPVKGLHVNVVQRRVTMPTRAPCWPRGCPPHGPGSFEQFLARKRQARSRRRM